jgi:hypothetical protein
MIRVNVKALKQRIGILVATEIAESWAGAGNPDDIEILRAEAIEARRNLESYLLRAQQRKNKP